MNYKAELSCNINLVCHKCGRRGRETIMNKVVHLGYTIHTGCLVCKNKGEFFRINKLDRDGIVISEYLDYESKTPVHAWVEPITGTNRMFKKLW